MWLFFKPYSSVKRYLKAYVALGVEKWLVCCSPINLKWHSYILSPATFLKECIWWFSSSVFAMLSPRWLPNSLESSHEREKLTLLLKNMTSYILTETKGFKTQSKIIDAHSWHLLLYFSQSDGSALPEARIFISH
jgi:hypothetical protein